MNRLLLTRFAFTERTTLGYLFIDGKPECFILEDQRRAKGVKIFGKTCIPAGVYEWEITESPKFGRRMVLIKGVNGFSGIRMHGGATHEHTDGCPLTGVTAERQANGDFAIGGGSFAEKKLHEKLEALGGKGTIEIREV